MIDKLGPEDAFIEACKDLAAAAEAKFARGEVCNTNEMIAVAVVHPEKFETAIRLKEGWKP